MERPAQTVETLPEYHMTIEDIMEVLPHRVPFLLVDRVTHLDPGNKIRGYKNVTINDPFFAGHFPGKPLMPGVLIIEAMAQIGCILVSKMPEGKDKLVVLAGIEKSRFRKPVVPGDILELQATLLKLRPPLGRAEGVALVNGEVAMEGEILFSLLPKAE